MPALLSIALFGAFGVTARYGVDRLFAQQASGFPVATLIVNVLGSFAAAWIFVLAERHAISAQLHTALLVGFCGGFTTFSAYTLHTLSLMEKGKPALPLLYFVLSPCLGLAAAYAGLLVARATLKV